MPWLARSLTTAQRLAPLGFVQLTPSIHWKICQGLLGGIQLRAGTEASVSSLARTLPLAYRRKRRNRHGQPRKQLKRQLYRTHIPRRFRPTRPVRVCPAWA